MIKTEELKLTQEWDKTFKKSDKVSRSKVTFVNQPILKYSGEIRSAVLLIHGEKAHSCYFSKDAYADMIEDSKYADNKELMIIPDAVHTDLYDGGEKDMIPFDRIQKFFRQYFMT